MEQVTFVFTLTFTSCISGKHFESQYNKQGQASSKSYVLSPALHKLGLVQHACNPSRPEVEAKESGVQGHSWLHCKFQASLDYETLPKKQIIIKVNNYKSLWFKIQNYKKLNLD